MSETTTQAETIDHVEPVATTEPQAPAVAETTAATETETPEPSATEKEAGKIRDRMARLSRQLGDTSRERDLLRGELEALRNASKPSGDPVTLKPEELQQHVQTAAEQLLAARAAAAENEKIGKTLNERVAAGQAEYGQVEFDAKTVDVLNVIPSDAKRADFRAIVADMDDGHRLVAALADDPDEAERIFGLPQARMGVALAKFAGKIQAPTTPPAKFSAAPPPIKPVTGAAKAEFNERTATAQELVAHYAKQAREQRAKG